MLIPIKRKTIAEGIIEQIKEQIMNGNYSPGDRLPTEKELADQLSVSRACVREAMRALSTLGLIEIKVGEGTFLTSSVAPLFSGELSAKFLIKKSSLLEVVEARKIIETQLAQLAAERTNDKQINELESILEKMNKKIEDGQPFSELDASFHIHVAEAAGNSILHESLSTIRQLLKSNSEEVVGGRNMPRVSYEQHRKIFNAIKDRSPKEAAEAMLEHLSALESNIRKLIPNE